MCETFQWIELLAVESQQDGLQIPVKISLGNDCERRESFSKYIKNANIGPSVINFNLLVRPTFYHAPHVLTYIKLK